MNKENLINFEKEVVNNLVNKKIKSPVHLSGGNEEPLIEIFKNIKKEDWVFTTYRSHYHALLKGVPQERLMNWILDNKSIHFFDKEYKIVSSAIVGGTLSQAVGVAYAIKLKKENRHVYLFCGDMTASLGSFFDCWRYAIYNELPITFVVENNGLSTDTPTKEAWGMKENNYHWYETLGMPKIIHYKYSRTFPHYGCGTFINYENKT